MLDLSFAEMLLAAVVALVVLGPERLPQAARTLGAWVGKVRAMAGSVKNTLAHQEGYDDLARLKQEVEQAAADIRGSLNEASTPPWARLPEMASPADFGVDESGLPLAGSRRADGRSPRKQALARKRDFRPRYRPVPRLRGRR